MVGVVSCARSDFQIPGRGFRVAGGVTVTDPQDHVRSRGYLSGGPWSLEHSSSKPHAQPVCFLVREVCNVKMRQRRYGAPRAFLRRSPTTLGR